MIRDLNPYPAYKDSGVLWLSEVPSHWDTWRARYLFREVDERSQHGTEAHLSMSQALGLVPSSMVDQTLTSESYAGGKLCQPDDLVLNRLKAHLGVFALASQEGVISPDYTVLRKRGQIFVRYYELVLRSPTCRGELWVRAKGIVEGFWRLYTDDFYDIRLPVPPRDEQATIVRFLGHADRRIRRYIRAKQKLITLLEEQKQSIIREAVSRGLDPHVRLGHDEVLCVGKVPEHWSVVRTKVLFHQSSIPVRDVDEMVTCFRDGQVTLRRNRRVTGFTNAIKELGYQGIRAGQLVLHSMDAFAGAVGVSDSDGKCSPEYVICDPMTLEIVPRYYGYLIRSMALRRLFVILCPSVRERAPRVRFSDFGAFVLPVPPRDEQVAIVNYIQERSLKLRAESERARREVDLLQEYRNRLVADVVTGKLDVREATAGLPDEPEEPELLDELGEADTEIEEDLDAELGVQEAEA